MTTRTDIHRPSVINPHEYELIAFDYIGPGYAGLSLMSERRAFQVHRRQIGRAHV